MKKKKTKKEKSYVCVICGKKSKTSKKVKCCGKDMTDKSKGSWNL